MQFPPSSNPVTGTVVPIGALKSARSCGIGEFADLIPFAELCKKAGIGLIQLLPVNDTGTESSPYSALSAFALHPVYLSLGDLPEADSFRKEINEIKTRFEDLPRFNYREIRNAKMTVLRRIFDVQEQAIMANRGISDWIAKNPWIVEYAVFMNLKHRNNEASWKQWSKMRTTTHKEIQDRWNSPARKSSHLFYAWVQMRLDEQFSAAVAACAKLGILIKGDIPILMNEDSCDAWANPEFFRDDLRAGSPPDDMNPLGQNWGFPIYNWDNLREADFDWWRRRLSLCSRYYNAYRIDHILGFFRIWSIPSGNESGCLGWTNPHEPVTTPELFERGFSGDRLRWLTEPHVPTRLVEEVNGHDYLGTHGLMHTLMDRIGNEELWLFKQEIKGERDILDSSLPEAVRGVLVQAWRDRLLLETGRDDRGLPLYAPIWNYRDTTAWKSLAEEERISLESLFRDKKAASEARWRDQAIEILGTLTRGTDMLPCAEDLGSIPDCVPEVLSSLGILGLKVMRWERRWNEPGQPLRDLRSYPECSVAASSVHDSSTLRGWWELEGGADIFLSEYPPERQGYPEGTSEKFRKECSCEVVLYVLTCLARSGSRILSIPIQDFLALSQDTRGVTIDSERINIPGSVSGFNWTWRLPDRIENLKKNRALILAISEVAKARSKSKTSEGEGK